MPWPSELTAQLAGSYGQMYSSIGIGGSGMGPMGMGMAADSAMGSVVSRMGASGGPILQGAMGMAGLDPISMGIRAGMGAWRGGAGLMGAGMSGMGMLGATAGVGLAASWGAGQVFTGMQNQQSFNMGMRQNFNFMNSSGGQGFSRQDMTAISSNLQSMTHQYGPGGEVNTFGELSRLAQNMGKMGLTTGVRDAQEFSKRFKDMVGTLKTVATELGTSLEAAQELLSNSRGSGIFRTADQLKYGAALRTTGLSGGLATSEMTAMGNIGSQIARSVGGLGRQGAMGGIRALGQVGTATQIGALSEEDIYNATGLTGAEGRQAMATQMMQNSGNFMKSSKGRWFLASIAGKNGSLDMDAVNQYMMGGGMDVQSTRDRAHSNLAGVGRANFIRNEGRLRSAAMEQFGGLAPALALTGWAQGKGININDMDDRSMLFAQRQLGMGRDELDATIKIAQNLPQIMQEQRRVASNDSFMQARGQHMKSEDIRTKLDQMKEGIQGKIQKWGADLYSSGSKWLEDVANRLLNHYETQMNEDVDKVTYNARFGGSGAQQSMREMFGTSSSLKMGRAAADKLGLTKAGGFNVGSNAGMEQYSRATLAAAATQAPGYVAPTIADIDKYKSGGPGLGAGDFFRGMGGYRSIAEANRQLGASMLTGISNNVDDTSLARKIGGGLLGLGHAAASVAQYAFTGKGAGASDSIMKDAVSTSMGYILGGSSSAAQDQARGDFLRSKEGRKLLGGLAGGDTSEAMSRMKELQSGEYSKLTDQDKGTLQALQMANLGVEYDRIKNTSMSPDEKNKKVQELLNQAGRSDAIKGALGGRKVTEQALEQWGTTAKAADYLNQRDNALQYADKMGKQGVDELAEMTKTGLIVRGKGGEMTLRAITKKDGLSADGSQAAKLALEITKDQANLVHITDEDARLRAIAGITDKTIGADGKGGLSAQIGNMSTADKRKFAKMMTGTQFGDLAMDLAAADTQVKGLMKGTRGNATAAAARMLGLHLGKDAEAGLSAEDLEKRIGMGGNADFDKSLRGALDAMKGGKNNAGQLMQQVLAGISDQARDKIKAQNEGDSDPLQKKIADNSDKSTQYLEALVKSNKDSAGMLQQIAQASKDNPEK